MIKIENQQHPKEAYNYALSRMLERGSFYGFRAILVLYMVGDRVQMTNADAMVVYSLVMSSLIFSPIIGALFGDLLIGNKKAILLGGIAQALGAFCLCIPSLNTLYIGLLLVVLGSGFYTPNIISTFGKLYLNKIKLLDSGFILFYLAVNLGSFSGVVLLGYIGGTFSYSIGFVLSGILMLLSLIPVLASKESVGNKFDKDKYIIKNRVFKIAIVVLLVAFFWGIYEMASFRMFDLQTKFSSISAFHWSHSLWQSMSSIIMLPVSVFAIFLYSYYYSSQIFKVVVGFIFAAFSFGVLMLLPEIPNEQDASLYLISLLLLSAAEIHIAPVVHSILTKFSNPKYLAILISLSFVPTKVVSLLFAFYNSNSIEDPIFGLQMAMITMALIGIGIIGFFMWNKKSI